MNEYVTNVYCGSCAVSKTAISPEYAKLFLAEHEHCRPTEVHVSVEVGEQRPAGLRLSWQTWLRVMLTTIFLLWAYGCLVRAMWIGLAAGIAIGLVTCAYLVWQELAEGDRRLKAARAEVLARCDEQHQQVMQGDPEGTFGVAAPVMKQLQEWENDD